ncbi:CPBP family glutamic-type intramembrane protease [Dictyobacter arantiisoli]|uniref:Abortive infection protein n=1 Tax=Dictyobacter arantiisoli TaxID=2014874 RepID=A0A5A5TG06_9CHLR|nr:CPBP family glutamic-type intramembrane protease [Dictyobacter arantiisoli]GCF09844.1 abortive infection protein [Dictyobacter arantiisoli]
MFIFFWPEFAILCGAALLGIICVTPYVLELSRDAFKKAQERMHRPLWVLALLQDAQSFVLMGVATGLGLLIAHHIGLGAPLLEGLLAGKSVTTQAQAAIAPALILGTVFATVLLLLEITVFWPRLPQVMRTTFPIPALWKRFLACFYGGIAEELLCRLFLLSLLAWLIGLAWHMPGGKPALGALWLANILAAVIFGLGHLPTTAALVKLTPLLIGRAILLNGIIGVAVGYLFWQYGLEAAILAHFVADLVLHVIGDSIAKKVRSMEAEALG